MMDKNALNVVWLMMLIFAFELGLVAGFLLWH